jgi:signal transduction histidine kinase
VNAAAPATDATAREIRVQQVRLLYEQAPLGTIASLLIAPVLVALTWNVIPRPVLLAWLALLLTTILVRLGLVVAFRRRQDQDTAIERWASGYTWACAASGICWGGSIVLLVLSPSLVYDTFIALVLGGVLMGGVLTMSPVLATYVAYALPLALPPVLWLLMQDDPLRGAMGAAGILYLLLALGTAHRYHHTLTRSLRLGLENLSVAESFAKAKEKAEETNRQLADQHAALQDSIEAMRELYNVISTPRRQASDQIQAMLAMGCQRFGMAIGILCHVDGQRYEIAQTIAPGGEVAQGDVLALADTYCRDTLRAQGPLGFEHASAGPWRQHPCYRKYGLEAYLGVPVRVDDQAYGTLSFSDFKPRPTSFTTVDREMIQLMAQWVGGALEQERMAEATQRQQALLAHASRLNTLGEMASGLVHEINQPVTAITLYADACLTRLRAQVIEPAEAREILEKIAAQSARASTIIQRIRRFARQGKTHRTAVRVYDLLDEVTDFLNLEARRQAIRITCDAAQDLPTVLADPLQIQQVILNLVRNAVDAMAASAGSGSIALSARSDRETVEIAVQDTGPGLAPELMNQLLLPFFTTKPDGLGLGLPISQAIVEAHGGRLWATPNQGPGATFHFTLPIADRDAAPQPAAAALSVAAG